MNLKSKPNSKIIHLTCCFFSKIIQFGIDRHKIKIQGLIDGNCKGDQIIFPAKQTENGVRISISDTCSGCKKQVECLLNHGYTIYEFNKKKGKIRSDEIWEFKQEEKD